MKKPNNPRSACSNCGSHDLVYVAKTNGAPGWRGYFCPACIKDWMTDLYGSYKQFTITISNTE